MATLLNRSGKPRRPIADRPNAKKPPNVPAVRPAPTTPRAIGDRIAQLQGRLGKPGGRDDATLQARIDTLGGNQGAAARAQNQRQRDRLMNPPVAKGPGGKVPFTSATPAQLPLIAPFIGSMDQQSTSMQALARMMGQLQPLQRERQVRATALGTLSDQIAGRGPAGSLYGLAPQYGQEIDAAVQGQLDVQGRAASEQYEAAKLQLMHTSAVQGFNPSGALAQLEQNYADNLANVQAGGASMRFGAGEQERARMLTRLQSLLGTSEVGMQLPATYQTALGGAFGQTGQASAQMQNVAFTPAQLLNAFTIASMGGGGGGGAKPEPDSPDFWQALLGQMAGAGAQGIGAALAPALVGAGGAVVGGIGDVISNWWNSGDSADQIGFTDGGANMYDGLVY